MSEENVNQPESILTNTFDFGPEWLQPEHTKELENVIFLINAFKAQAILDNEAESKTNWIVETTIMSQILPLDQLKPLFADVPPNVTLPPELQ